MGVNIRALELWQNRGGEDQGVTKTEVPQNGREDSYEQFGVVDLERKDVVIFRLQSIKLNFYTDQQIQSQMNWLQYNVIVDNPGLM